MSVSLNPIIELIYTKIHDIFAKQRLSIEFSVSLSEKESYGHVTSNIALVASKILNKTPLEIAENIYQEIKQDNEFFKNFDKIEIVKPGFINFFISDICFLCNFDYLNKIDSSIDFLKSQKILVEHTSANPNKAMHIGHLRNNLIGESISNILEFLGAEVIRDYVNNDRGIAIAKLMWGFLKFARKSDDSQIDIDYWINNKDEWHSPESLNIKEDVFIDNLYVKGSIDFDNSSLVQEKVRQMVVDWENNDPNTRELWRYLIDISIRSQKQILKRLKSNFNNVWNESDHYIIGKTMIIEGLEKGIFRKTDDGTIITNLSSFGLPDTVVLKSDGTSLYITQDIALTKLKKEKFNPDKMIWIIGPEQSLAMQQLFSVCDQLGIAKKEDLIHISYGYITIKGSGKISSRKGNSIFINFLIDSVAKKIQQKTIQSGKIPKDEVEEYVEILALASIKYSILKVGRTINIDFNIDSAISTEGDTAIYVMYTYVRSMSILQKYSDSADINLTELLKNINLNQLTLTDTEKILLVNLFNFKQIVKESFTDFQPNKVCNYIFKLANIFNSFYTTHAVLVSDNNIRLKRLFFISVYSKVIRLAFRLLGIEVIDKM